MFSFLYCNAFVVFLDAVFGSAQDVNVSSVVHLGLFPNNLLSLYGTVLQTALHIASDV